HLDKVVSFEREKDKLERQVTIGEAKLAALNFDMELQFSTLPKITGKDDFDIKLKPTDSTFTILERWKEMNAIGADIPYPSDSIDHHDWQGIDVFFNEYKSELKKEN